MCYYYHGKVEGKQKPSTFFSFAKENMAFIEASARDLISRVWRFLFAQNLDDDPE